MMSAGPFVAGLKCSGNIFGGFRTLQLIAIHLITRHNILEYMQNAIIQTEEADFVKINICVILNFWPRLYKDWFSNVRPQLLFSPMLNSIDRILPGVDSVMEKTHLTKNTIIVDYTECMLQG